MTEILAPQTPEQLCEAIAWAIYGGHAFEVMGSGAKRALGRPVTADAQLLLGAFSGIQEYEPTELVITCGAATPMAELERAIAQKNQRFQFEPPDLGALLGGAAGQGTIGGVIGANLAGPRRIMAGGARDHTLGFHAVSGRGEVFKSGGTVVKNVTGFDLSKLMAGSYGTLAVMTRLSVKVMPAPEKTRTVLVLGADAEAGRDALGRALASPWEVSGAAHLPAAAAARSSVAYVAQAGAAVTAIRVEGPGPSVEFRARALRDELAGIGETEELHSQNSAAFWREVRDVAPFAGAGDERQVWRLSVAPSRGPGVAASVLDRVPGEAFSDWGGGLIWLALDAADDAHADLVRGALGAMGGHATLVRANPRVRARVPVFQPQPAPLAALTVRVKDGFDAKRVLNPGRMVDGV